jgi:hypothetical protein
VIALRSLFEQNVSGQRLDFQFTGSCSGQLATRANIASRRLRGKRHVRQAETAPEGQRAATPQQSVKDIMDRFASRGEPKERPPEAAKAGAATAGAAKRGRPPVIKSSAKAAAKTPSKACPPKKKGKTEDASTSSASKDAHIDEILRKPSISCSGNRLEVCAQTDTKSRLCVLTMNFVPGHDMRKFAEQIRKAIDGGKTTKNHVLKMREKLLAKAPAPCKRAK